MLSDAAVQHCADLQEFASDSDAIDTDEEVESESLIFDQFSENGGASAIIQTTNVSPKKFYVPWCALDKAIKEGYNAGRAQMFAFSSGCPFS